MLNSKRWCCAPGGERIRVEDESPAGCKGGPLGIAECGAVVIWRRRAAGWMRAGGRGRGRGRGGEGAVGKRRRQVVKVSLATDRPLSVVSAWGTR